MTKTKSKKEGLEDRLGVVLDRLGVVLGRLGCRLGVKIVLSPSVALVFFENSLFRC